MKKIANQFLQVREEISRRKNKMLQCLEAWSRRGGPLEEGRSFDSPQRTRTDNEKQPVEVETREKVHTGTCNEATN